MSIAYTGEVSAAGEHEELAGRSMNWWGMAFFIASEALIFANLIASYLYLKSVMVTGNRLLITSFP
jgi:heme/copper-type cytochrome/quinol oxidase subunit 3